MPVEKKTKFKSGNLNARTKAPERKDKDHRYGGGRLMVLGKGRAPRPGETYSKRVPCIVPSRGAVASLGPSRALRRPAPEARRGGRRRAARSGGGVRGDSGDGQSRETFEDNGDGESHECANRRGSLSTE